MLPLSATDYADVFIETNYESLNPLVGQATAFILVAIVIGMWLMVGMPGSHSLPSKIRNRSATVSIVVMVGLSIIGVVSGVMGVAHTVGESSKAEQVVKNMEDNIAKKYDANLVVSAHDIPDSANRDKPNEYTLTFVSEDGKSLQQRYNITFDRATSEPFISELKVPTADELNESAKK